MADLDSTTIVYRIDSDDRLAYVNDNWYSFARSNQAPELAEPSILQHSLWEYIVDFETRMIYEMLFAKVRTGRTLIDFPFRCDTPTFRRFMRMELHPQSDDGILLVSRVTAVEARPFALLLDASITRSQSFLIICSWCKRVELPPGYWCEVEEAIESLGLFGTTNLPKLSHGMCRQCSLTFRSTFSSG